MKIHDNVVRIRADKYLGFTLIELMITVAIVAILAAVAYPLYQTQLLKGRRASAQALMADIANREQQYLLDARDYAVDPGALTALNLAVPTDVSKYYTITVANITAPPPPNYTITATPIAGQVPDGVMTLTNAGNKTRNGQPGW
jgi:type IV pilus assembly protein PilE